VARAPGRASTDKQANWKLYGLIAVVVIAVIIAGIAGYKSFGGGASDVETPQSMSADGVAGSSGDDPREARMELTPLAEGGNN
jgi:hypothetical protein